MARKRYTAEQIINYLREAEIFISQGPVLSAVVKQQYKRHFAGAAPGLAGAGFLISTRMPARSIR